MVGCVLLGALIALGSVQCGFWCAVWALREARGRPAFEQASEVAMPQEDLFESLMGY